MPEDGLRVGEPIRVLAIEDDPDMVRLIETVLKERFAPEVQMAAGWAEAKEKLDSSSFDLITLACVLADCDGLELLKDITSLGDPPPVIVVTGKGGERVAARAISLGASGYIVKDRDFSDLLPEAVEKALSEAALARAEKALRKSEEMYRTLVDTSPDGILVTDLETNITNVSVRAYEMFGYDRSEDMVGRNALEFFVPGERERAAADFQKRLTNSLKGNVDYQFARKDGSVFFGELNVAPLKDAQGNVAGVIGVLRDATERKLMEEKFNRVNQELDSFAYIASHDLKAPLSAIGAASEAVKHLLKPPNSANLGFEISELAQIISDNVDKSASLIDALLGLARAGQEPQAVASIDIWSTVWQVLQERAAEIEEKNVEVKVSDNLGEVVADPTHIYQLFSNLIGNAISHNDSPGPLVEVSRVEDTAEGIHHFMVRDNGSGIPFQEMDKVFTPLYGCDRGVGLSIVQAIVKVYDGEIKFCNDNGVCFEVVIKDAVS